MKTLLKLALIFASIATIAFPPGYATKKVKNDPNALFTGTVMEVLTAGNYTYVKVKEDKSNKWVATSPTKILKGDKVEFLKGPAMKDFYSKSLKKNFKEI